MAPGLAPRGSDTSSGCTSHGALVVVNAIYGRSTGTSAGAAVTPLAFKLADNGHHPLNELYVRRVKFL